MWLKGKFLAANSKKRKRKKNTSIPCRSKQLGVSVLKEK